VNIVYHYESKNAVEYVTNENNNRDLLYDGKRPQKKKISKKNSVKDTERIHLQDIARGMREEENNSEESNTGVINPHRLERPSFSTAVTERLVGVPAFG